jgi:hypothetical protein
MHSKAYALTVTALNQGLKSGGYIGITPPMVSVIIQSPITPRLCPKLIPKTSNNTTPHAKTHTPLGIKYCISTHLMHATWLICCFDTTNYAFFA